MATLTHCLEIVCKREHIVVMPPQKSTRPPRAYFLKGRALAKEICNNPRLLLEAEHADLKWIEQITKEYTPIAEVGVPMQLAHPLIEVSVDFVFAHQKYSKQKNLKFDGEVTLESYGFFVCEMARMARFPTIDEAGLFIGSFDSNSKTFPFVDNRYLPYLDRVYHFLKSIDRTDELSSFAMLANNLRPAGLCNVRIGPSSLHGEGVFAQRDLKRGDLVTLHPCHYISINMGKEGSAWLKAKVDLPSVTLMLSKLLFQYSAKVEGTCLSIAADPTIPATPAACAHLINDGATLDTPDFDYRLLQKYIVDSTNAQNCHFVTLGGVSVAAVASRDIRRGDEIFTAYGALFWSHLLSQ